MAAQAVHTEHGKLVFWTTPELSEKDSLVPGGNYLGNMRPSVNGGHRKEIKAGMSVVQSTVEEDLNSPSPRTQSSGSSSVSQHVSETAMCKQVTTASGQGGSLRNLCVEDKKRVANLIKELTRLEEEKENAEKKLEEERKRYEEQILSLVAQQEQLLNHEVEKTLVEYQTHILKLQQQKRHPLKQQDHCQQQVILPVQARLQELDAVNKLGNGSVKAVEARLRREIEDLKRDMNTQLADIEDYKTRLQELGESETQLREINAELSHQMEQMVNDFDRDKQAALESCQRTIEAVNRESFDKFRQDIEERFQREKITLMEDSKSKLDNLNHELRSTRIELDNVKIVYVNVCEEHAKREAELKESHRTQLEEQLGKITAKLEKEKREWESFMRAKLEKEQEEFKISLRQTYKFKKVSPKHMGIMNQHDASSKTPIPCSLRLSSIQQNAPAMIDKLHLVEDNYIPLGNPPAKSQPGHADPVLELFGVKRHVRSDISRQQFSRDDMSGADISIQQFSRDYMSGADTSIQQFSRDYMSGADTSIQQCSRDDMSGADISIQQGSRDVLGCVNSSGSKLGFSKATDGVGPWDDRFALLHDKMSLEEVIQILNCPSRECMCTPLKSPDNGANVCTEAVLGAVSRQRDASKATDGVGPWDDRFALLHDKMSLEEVIQVLNFPNRECVSTPHKSPDNGANICTEAITDDNAEVNDDSEGF